MNWNQALFPSLKRRGGCAIKKMSRRNLSSRRRGGGKRKPDRAQPQEKIGVIFRPEEFRRTDHPVCGASEASRLFINAAASPPFQRVLQNTARIFNCCKSEGESRENGSGSPRLNAPDVYGSVRRPRKFTWRLSTHSP